MGIGKVGVIPVMNIGKVGLCRNYASACAPEPTGKSWRADDAHRARARGYAPFLHECAYARVARLGAARCQLTLGRQQQSVEVSAVLRRQAQ